jgi:Flp pilus assembly protein TadD
VLKVSEERTQDVTIRLPLPVAQTPRSQPTAAPRTAQARFDTALQQGIELYKTGWFGPAAGRFREAVTIDPRSPQAHLWLGRALIRSDRQVEARRALEKVIELSGTGPQADEAAMLLSRLP